MDSRSCGGKMTVDFLIFLITIIFSEKEGLWKI